MKQITSTELKTLTEQRSCEAYICGKRGRAMIKGNFGLIELWDTLPTGSMRLKVGNTTYTNLRTDLRAERFKGAFI